MAYSDFTFPAVLADLGLTLAEADLFGHVPPATVAPEFLARLASDVPLALAINTEKARSGIIIAPVLVQLWRASGGAFGLFSGTVFDVDAARGLSGFCDFILTRSPIQAVVTAPVVAIAGAKIDNTRTGLGQCIAGMVAARDFNARTQRPGAVYGVSTTGAAWRFARLTGDELTLDRPEYFITDPGRILGILGHILRDG